MICCNLYYNTNPHHSSLHPTVTKMMWSFRSHVQLYVWNELPSEVKRTSMDNVSTQ